MKKISVILGLAFVIVTFCMFYLVRNGVSLRSEPLIKPTEISTDHRNIAEHLMLRLFPELQQNHYILWGVLPETQESQRVLSYALEEYEKMFKVPVHMIRDGVNATDAELRACAKPCWVLLPTEQANELTPNELVEKKFHSMNLPFITLTWVNFDNTEKVTDECEAQQRLHLDCLIPVSIREVQKRIKDPSKLHFFLRKYNDRDYFLFVQKEASPN